MLMSPPHRLQNSGSDDEAPQCGQVAVRSVMLAGVSAARLARYSGLVALASIARAAASCKRARCHGSRTFLTLRPALWYPPEGASGPRLTRFLRGPARPCVQSRVRHAVGPQSRRPSW
jgi:hypothetical protein